MKKEITKEELKTTGFGNTIHRLRKERGYTQQKLADLVGNSNRTISKWEKGTTVPDLATIQALCKVLEVSPRVLIKSEKGLKDYFYDFKRFTKNLIKFIIKHITLIIFSMLFILLFLYFINNFNRIKIYNITYIENTITYDNAYFFRTRTFNVLVFNNINLNKIKYEPTSIYLELFTYLNGDKYIIYKSTSLDNIFIEESRSYADLLTKDVIESMKDNLYIIIYTKDNDGNNYTYETKLVLKERENNNKLIYKDYTRETIKTQKDLATKNPFLVSLTKSYDNKFIFLEEKDIDKPDNTNNENKLASLGYTFNKETNTYTKIDDDGGIIEYKPVTGTLKKEIIIENLKYSTRYSIDREYVLYNIVNMKNEFVMNLSYHIPTKSTICSTNNCKNYKKEIDHILSVYAALENIL